MAIYQLKSVTGKDHVQTVYCRKDNPIEVILRLDDKEYDYTAAKENPLEELSERLDPN